MKKFTKLFLSCTAVAALTAAIATSAMAAGEISVEYTAPAEGATTADLAITATYDADQKTLLVLKHTADKTAITAEDVVQIDQKDIYADAVKLPADLADGTYTVLMGGDGTVYDTTFRVGAATGEDYLVGDVNFNGNIRANDADAVLWYTVNPESVNKENVGKTITTADGDVLVGDVNFNGNIRANDADAILWYTVNPESANKENVGETINGTLAE